MDDATHKPSEIKSLLEEHPPFHDRFTPPS